MKTVFNFLDYKEFLKYLIAEHSEKRGYQGQLAEAAGCQSAYLSQALRSHVHLTPEHACNLAHFLGLNEMETDYFLLLVDFARAGSRRLQQRIKSQLEKLKTDSERFSKRLKAKALTSAEDQARYYSAWHWIAIHVMTGIPEAQTPKAIAERLKLPLELVQDTLRGLKSMGLVIYENDRWQFVGTNWHLPAESPLNPMSHQNWRAKAVQDSHNASSDGLHYTFCFTVTRSDYEKLKTMLIEFVDQQRKLIAPSESEELVCFTYDLFRVG